MKVLALRRLEVAAVVILIANVPTCQLGLVGLGIGLDDASGRWTSDVLAPLLIFSYFPTALAAVSIATFVTMREPFRRALLWGVASAGVAVLVSTALLFSPWFL
jgi:hypothetical protein